MDNKVQESTGYVYVPHVETKSVFTFQPIKRLVSSTVKSAKPSAAFWFEDAFKDQKPTNMLFGGDGTHCFARKTSRDYEKKPTLFWKKYLRQSQPSTSELESKKVKIIQLLA